MTPTIRQVPRAQQAPETEQAAPSPALFFDTIRAFQQSAPGTALICLKCGLIQWFAEKPVRVQS
jgi:hypothetical protein